MNSIFRPSVRMSVCLSVTPFWLCSHHRIVMNFSGVITNDKSDVHAKVQGQRSKVKVTEIITQLSRFRTVTPVLIHQWLWNDTESLRQHREGALLFFNVIRQIWRSHWTKKSSILTPIERFRTVALVWIHWWLWNDAESLKQHRRGHTIEEVPYCFSRSSVKVPYCFSRSSVKFQGHTGNKIADFDPNWAFPDCNSSFNSPMALKWCTKFNLA